MILTSQHEFLEWKGQGFNWLPVIAEISKPNLNPLELFLAVANTPRSYLLEPGYDGKNYGRYSYIGLSSNTTVCVQNYHVNYREQNKVLEDKQVTAPLKLIESIIESYKVPFLSFPFFYGGFVGYFGYETVSYIEPRLEKKSKHDVLNVPDILLMLTEDLMVYDSLEKKLFIIVYVKPNNESAYNNAIAKIKSIKKQLLRPIPPIMSHPISSDKFSSNFTEANYETAVEKAKSYFAAGDVMQLILSQRFSKTFTQDPFLLYKVLRKLNPSPYMYYLKLDDFYIVGASPEILVQVRENQVTVKPLAGTRPRGQTENEDKELELELLQDKKEIAEHLMLIDLGRNDIGKVCEIGSVKVTEQMKIERFSHVMHISSTVVGTIKEPISMMDVLKAAFPAGTVSGAPKIRAMEIISELEGDKRGVYGGAIGYIGWHKQLDTAIALRSAVIKNDTIYIQTGAGLVADSEPKKEWQECINKGRALFLATELAEQLENKHDFDDR